MRILTVEDEEGTARLVSRLLKSKMGATVDIAADCAAARERLSSTSYDLITLDHQLPDGDGLSLLEEIAGSAGAPPVVMVTGHGDEETAVNAFKLGASGYVVKGARMSTLLVEEARSAIARARLKIADEALRSQVQELLAIFNAFEGIMYVADMETYEIIEANRYCEELFGPDLVGRSCYEALQGGQSEPCPFCTNESLVNDDGEPNPPVVWEFKNTRTGNWYQYIDKAVPWPGGRLVRMEIGLDITERMRTEEELRRKESEARKLLDSILSPDLGEGAIDLAHIIDAIAVQSIMDDFHRLTDIGVAIVDLSGNVLVATGWQDICTKFHRVHPDSRHNCVESDTLLSMGVEPGELKIYRCKNNMWDIATPIMVGGRHAGNLFLGQFLFEDEAPEYEVFREQARQYDFNEDEYLDALERVPRWSRETVGNVMSFYAKFANLISSLGHSNIKLAQDLLERGRLLDSLHQSEELLNATQRLSRTGGWEWNVTRQAMFWTEETYRIHGFTPDMLEPGSSEHIEQSIECYEPDDRPVILAAFKRCIEHGEPYDLELPLTAADGRSLWIRTTAFAVREGGKVVKVMGNIMDITNRKAVEESLLRANAELEAFTSAVSHDLKSPLTSVTAAVELLANITAGEGSIEPDGGVGEVLDIIRHGACRATALIDDLLALARAGLEPGNREPVDITNLVKLILEDKKMEIDASGAEVKVGDDLGFVNMDPAHAYQVFANLTGNALKHGESPSPVIEVNSLPAGEKGIRRYLVRDNGPGIPEDDLDRVFEPFFMSGKSGDTGIGLSIVGKVVNLYGGSVLARNDGGACFEFTLPEHTPRGNGR